MVFQCENTLARHRNDRRKHWSANSHCSEYKLPAISLLHPQTLKLTLNGTVRVVFGEVQRTENMPGHSFSPLGECDAQIFNRNSSKPLCIIKFSKTHTQMPSEYNIHWSKAILISINYIRLCLCMFLVILFFDSTMYRNIFLLVFDYCCCVWLLIEWIVFLFYFFLFVYFFIRI